VRAAAVGSHTALEAAAQGWQVELVPSSENADGLLEIMSRMDVRGRRVWIPAGNREGSARGRLPQTLRERGADVQVFTVYETRDRVFTTSDEAHLNEAESGAVVFHSPSAVDAVYSKAETTSVRRWLGAELVAIGPTTAARAREKGLDRVHEAPEPSDPALLSLLVSLGKWERAASGNLERKRV
ncbi:MAG TPA: uroporphyrinogen-III synthase, partial [Candidatus Eisenbacteria bacterium]|nr:uroporphyrinogen-III synthase [Candidatus Eisenbacteria bacterium]